MSHAPHENNEKGEKRKERGCLLIARVFIRAARNSLWESELGLVADSLDEDNAIEDSLAYARSKLLVRKVQAQVDVLAEDALDERLALVEARVRLPPEELAVHPWVHLQSEIPAVLVTLPLEIKLGRLTNMWNNTHSVIVHFYSLVVN